MYGQNFQSLTGNSDVSITIKWKILERGKRNPINIRKDYAVWYQGV